MTTQWKARLFVVGLVVAPWSLSLTGCNLDELKKANEKVAESNELFDDARTLAKKADALKAEAADADEPARKAGGKKCKAKYDEASEKLDDAAKLVKEASKLRVSKEFGKYLSLKSKQFGKVSEGLGAHAGMCVQLSKEPDQEKLEKLVKEAKAAFAEADDLSDEAEKIRKDNPTQFKD